MSPRSRPTRTATVTWVSCRLSWVNRRARWKYNSLRPAAPPKSVSSGVKLKTGRSTSRQLGLKATHLPTILVCAAPPPPQDAQHRRDVGDPGLRGSMIFIVFVSPGWHPGLLYVHASGVRFYRAGFLCTTVNQILFVSRRFSWGW